MVDEEARTPFKVWMNDLDATTPGFVQANNATIKHGPHVYKSASLITVADEATGEVSHRKLRVVTVRKKA